MIGVVGPDTAAERLAEAIGGRAVRTGSIAEVLADDPDVVVAVGSQAVSDLVRVGTRAPVLAVDCGDVLPSVPETQVPALVEEGLDGGFETCERPVLGVTNEGEAASRGLFEAMLVTAEPSRISEYAVETPGGTDRFRADGVVVATPAGSRDYVRALGGPSLDAGTESLVVAPVGAFAIRPTVRVVGDDERVAIRVERDEGDVALYVDRTERGSVRPGRWVAIEVVDTVETVKPPADEARRLEKL